MFITTTKRHRRGFTLIEIMIVLVIIGFIASLGTVAVMNRLKRSQDMTAKAMLDGTLSTALDMYYTDNFTYPTTEQGLVALVKKPTTSPAPSNWTKPYLKKLDDDPWGQPYQYRQPSEHNLDYDIWSFGPDKQGGTEDDITLWEKEK